MNKCPRLMGQFATKAARLLYTILTYFAAKSPPPSISSFLARRCACRFALDTCVSLVLINCACLPSFPLKIVDLVGFWNKIHIG